MARREKEKENKLNLKVWIPIICVIVVIITVYLIYNKQNKAEENKISDNANSLEIEENIENEGFDNSDETQQDITENNTANKNTESNQAPSATKVGVTDQKQKAIELVKKEWGEDDTVNYVFDYVNENGEYVVAVKDKASATVKNYFRVNLETETVELD